MLSGTLLAAVSETQIRVDGDLAPTLFGLIQNYAEGWSVWQLPLCGWKEVGR